MTSESDDLQRELADAHRQLLERDHAIRELQREKADIADALQAVLETRVWRTAERVRRWRDRLRTRT